MTKQEFVLPERIRVIDSHTGGEPTRTLIDGSPPMPADSIAEQLTVFRTDFDDLRTATLLEPRGNDVLVGALLCKPRSERAVAGVIFFNNDGYLGMCGHGMIGFAVTLFHLGKIGVGQHLVETVVGEVSIDLKNANDVCIGNVPSYRFQTGVSVQTKSYGEVIGDIAWGGNWFFITETSPAPLQVAEHRRLTDFTTEVRQAIEAAGITGANGGVIDHIEISGLPVSSTADGRNFVLCPGLAYDRSPCGTGTSAKVACLAADGKLAPGEIWNQESIVGSIFQASYEFADEQPAEDPAGAPVILPNITGNAFVTADSELIFQPTDPFAKGIAT